MAPCTILIEIKRNIHLLKRGRAFFANAQHSPSNADQRASRMFVGRPRTASAGRAWISCTVNYATEVIMGTTITTRRLS